MIEFAFEFDQNDVDTRKGFRVTSASRRMNLCVARMARPERVRRSGAEKSQAEALDTNAGKAL